MQYQPSWNNNTYEDKKDNERLKYKLKLIGKQYIALKFSTERHGTIN